MGTHHHIGTACEYNIYLFLLFQIHPSCHVSYVNTRTHTHTHTYIHTHIHTHTYTHTCMHTPLTPHATNADTTSKCMSTYHARQSHGLSLPHRPFGLRVSHARNGVGPPLELAELQVTDGLLLLDRSATVRVDAVSRVAAFQCEHHATLLLPIRGQDCICYLLL
jgi:hypothetical protein